MPFAHPLYVLFSSGTTGLPKAIVHGHGGILLEHLKNHALSWDIRPGDRLQWFTTTAWMMWNALVSTLLVRASIVLIDGNPIYPDLSAQWRLAEQVRPTMLGLSPSFVMASRKEGVEPGRHFDLSSIRTLGAAGSPLPLEGFAWVYEQFEPTVLPQPRQRRHRRLHRHRAGQPAASGLRRRDVGPLSRRRRAGVRRRRHSGGGRARRAGDLQADAVDAGRVLERPDGSRYRAAYFDEFPGVWRHGDWIAFTERGSSVITGRSDATLNRGGVRLGTSEFYAVVEEFDDVTDSLVVHLEANDELLLFVVLRPGMDLDPELRTRIARALRDGLSPRHAPDDVVAVPAIPRTLTGKKLELPVKRILTGTPAEDVASADALVDPAAIEPFVVYARTRVQLG